MDTAEGSGAVGTAIRRWRRQMEAADFGHTPGIFVLLIGLVFFAWGEIYSLFPPTRAYTFGTKCAAANAGCPHVDGRMRRLCGTQSEYRRSHFKSMPFLYTAGF